MPEGGRVRAVKESFRKVDIHDFPEEWLFGRDRIHPPLPPLQVVFVPTNRTDHGRLPGRHKP